MGFHAEIRKMQIVFDLCLGPDLNVLGLVFLALALKRFLSLWPRLYYNTGIYHYVKLH